MDITESRWAKNIYEKSRHLNYGRHIIIGWIDEILRRRPGAEGVRIFDLGLGQADDLRTIRARFPERRLQLNGIDCYQPNIEQASKLGITVYNLDIEHEPIPAPDASVDIVIANQIIEHAKEVFWIFSEVSRILKPGGFVIVGTPNLASLHNRILVQLGQQPTSIELLGPHVRGITCPAFKRFIEADGFFALRCRKGSNMYPFPSAISRILCALLPGFSASIFFLVQRTPKPGTFIEVLASRSYETPFFCGKPKSMRSQS